MGNFYSFWWHYYLPDTLKPIAYLFISVSPVPEGRRRAYFKTPDVFWLPISGTIENIDGFIIWQLV